MPDREKVIIEFERCIGFFSPADTSDDYFKCVCQRVLELLKEQEPVPPRKAKRYIEYSDTAINFPVTYYCGGCGDELPDNAKYCPRCGRAVKWDDDINMP